MGGGGSSEEKKKERSEESAEFAGQNYPFFFVNR